MDTRETTFLTVASDAHAYPKPAPVSHCMPVVESRPHFGVVRTEQFLLSHTFFIEPFSLSDVLKKKSFFCSDLETVKGCWRYTVDGRYWPAKAVVPDDKSIVGHHFEHCSPLFIDRSGFAGLSRKRLIDHDKYCNQDCHMIKFWEKARRYDMIEDVTVVSRHGAGNEAPPYRAWKPVFY